MSLALLRTQHGNPFLDRPHSRSNTLSTISNDTVRYYGCRKVSSGASAASVPSSKKSTAALDVGLHEHGLDGIIGGSNDHRPLNDTDCRTRHTMTSATISPSSFHTISLGSRQPSDLFDGFSEVGHANLESEINPGGGSDKSDREQDVDEDGREDSRNAAHQNPFEQPLLADAALQNFDPAPFRRWLSKLRGHDRPSYDREPLRHLLSSESTDAFPDICENSPECRRLAPDRQHQRQSESQTSSSAFFRGVKTATATLAGSSIAPRSWISSRLAQRRADRASRPGYGSEDSTTSRLEFLDEAACSRAVQRRKILEELIESEEGYVADLKVLTNVYFTLLASVCALSTQAKALVRENLSEILEMHEQLLGELYEAVPHSEYNQKLAKEAPTFNPKAHVRWHSADSGVAKLNDSRLARRLRHSVDLARPPRRFAVGTVADPETTAAVAKVFQRFLPRFFAYEQYGAKYEMMIRDMAATYKTLSTHMAYERGIEVLSRTLESIDNRDQRSRKGVTFADLLIKPIQRVCKYPLLFADLAKHTPVTDGPEAHGDVSKVLFRLKETAREINRATDDPSARLLIEKTWNLQDRLVFADEVAPLTKQILGHVLLCGVLHVAYQTRYSITGQYMLCALFKSCLVIAIPRKGLGTFEVAASIPLACISVEEPDNGRGLQCHSAPFTWKVVFESQHRLFELVLSACSPAEENQWRKQLNERNCIENLESSDSVTITQDICAALSLDLKPLGTLYGQPHTLARRISIHRAATVGPKSLSGHVIIKHTDSTDQALPHPSSLSLPLSRSRSMLSARHIPVLAPRRSERVALEHALADVWTKDLLPFPGMKQYDNPFKISANHVMRKLSMASISSSFSRRTSSFTQVSRPDSDEAANPLVTATQFPVRDNTFRGPPRRVLPSTSLGVPFASPAVTIDFHTTPEMFLPPDFELKDPRLTKPSRRNLTIRTINDEGVSVDNLENQNTRPQSGPNQKQLVRQNSTSKMRHADPLSPRRKHSTNITQPGKRRAKSPSPLTRQLKKIFT